MRPETELDEASIGRRRLREQRMTRRVAAAFVLSALSSIGLTVVYALGGQPQIEGALLGGALGGLAVAFVLWGKYLMPVRLYVEERAPMEPEAEDRAMFAREAAGSEEVLRRRTFLVRMVLGALAALGVAAVFPVRSLGPSPGRALFVTSWQRGSRLVTAPGQPVSVDAIPVGGVLTVFPEEAPAAADSQVVLVRAAAGDIVTRPGRETWAPNGYVGYSKICTHAGCPVGLYEHPTRRLFCPCHQSIFDVMDAARPTAGPATRPLPQLPLMVDEQGFLRAQSDFQEVPGPGFWNLPRA